MRRSLLLALVVALAAAACREPEAPAVAPAEEAGGPAAPVGVNEVVALEAAEARVWVATSAGVVLFLPDTGAWTLFAGEGTLAHDRATSLDVGPDGTAWTGHSLLPEEGEPGEAAPQPAAGRTGPRRGGVRAFRPDGSVQAWFVADGLPSDDVTAVAVTDDGTVAAATSEGLALLKPLAAGTSGPARFEAVPFAPRRRITLVDPAAGGTTRTVTELVPRGERITALATSGTRLWIGTSHGLLASEGESRMRYVLPACRRDGVAPDAVVALGAWSGGLAAAVGLQRDDGVEPSGAVEIALSGPPRCHVPGVDVPAALTPSVATDGRTTWLATYEGLVRLQGGEVELLERGLDLPRVPPTAVATDGQGGAWAGFWGAGVAHVRREEVALWRFGAGAGGTAVPQLSRLAR